mgnify:CR=1 FL=1
MQVVAPMPDLTTQSGGSQEVFNSNVGYDEQRQDECQSRKPRKKRRGGDKNDKTGDAPKASTEANLAEMSSTVIVTDEETADLDTHAAATDKTEKAEVDGPAVKTGDWQGGSY